MQQSQKTMLTGLGIGAGLMYFLDPQRGRRRRALVRDQIAHSASASAEVIGGRGRDIANRAKGLAAKARRAWPHAVDDDVLIDRVRAQLGRFVSHPRAIAVQAINGEITLRGPVLRAELDRLLQAVAAVPGVRKVVSALQAQDEAGTAPGLQGGSAASPADESMPKSRWSSAARAMMGTTGAALAGYGALRRDTRGLLCAASGLGLLARTTRVGGRLNRIARRSARMSH